MRSLVLLMVVSLALSACGDNFVPNPKVAGYNAETGRLVPAHPCPDWSQTQTYNYLNQTHSNFGCAVNNDLAQQVADPQDLVRGHGGGSDAGTSTRIIELYRAGTLPAPLTPLQPSSSGGTQ